MILPYAKRPFGSSEVENHQRCADHVSTSLDTNGAVACAGQKGAMA